MSYVHSSGCTNGNKEFKLPFNHVLRCQRNPREAHRHEERFKKIVILQKKYGRIRSSIHCIITGLTNCGKTKYLIEQLRGQFENVFGYIILICLTCDRNKTYRGFAENGKNLLVLMPDASNHAVLFSGTNTLIILDDCAVSKDFKNRSNKFIELAFSGRYKGLSVWV